jgi:hypothetical protein
MLDGRWSVAWNEDHNEALRSKIVPTMATPVKTQENCSLPSWAARTVSQDNRRP